jgi:predicted ATPase
MRGLNVLIGANGSGKSNLIEVLALLRASPKSLPAPIKEMGGVREWLWKGDGIAKEAVIDAVVTNPGKAMDLRHVLSIREHGNRFEVVDERIENEKAYEGKSKDPFFYYRYQRGHPVLQDFQDEKRKLKREQVLPEESILSQVKDPERYPILTRLQDAYGDIRLFRNWSFGPGAALRREQSAQGRSDFLEDGGDNLALVLSNIRNKVKKDLSRSLKKLYDGIEDVAFEIGGGALQLFIEETGGRQISATRLSDGTLRYLCLLAILIHPEPPPLIAIEEPELGLHPDVIPHIADLLIGAATRTQIVVTTHSRTLVDALADCPESVIVCERRGEESCFERLEADRLRIWLERYSLGELWSIGELGGNRW